MTTSPLMSAWDYIVFALMFVFSAGVGFYFAVKDRRNASMDNFHLGRRKGHVIPVSLSLSVSIISASRLVGLPAEFYVYGTMYFWHILGMLVAIVTASIIVVPILYKLNRISVFGYIEMRFGITMQYVSAFLYVLKGFISLSFVLYAPCLSYRAMTGSSLYIALADSAMVCTLYTLLGGIKAVVWTDTLQFSLMIAGLLSVGIIGANNVGGLAKAWRIADDFGRLDFDNVSADPTTRHSVWGLVIGYGFIWLYAQGAQQATVQRVFTLPTLRQAQFSMLLSYVGMFAIALLSSITGIIMIAFYRECDPISSGPVRNKNEMFPLLALDVLSIYPGLPGLLLAGLFSSALSTVSSGFNGISAVVIEDLIKPFWPKNLSDKAQLNITKGFVILLGASLFGISAGVAQMDGLIIQNIISMSSSFSGPALGMYFSGMLFPWTNKHGALAGLIISTAAVLWLIIGKAIVKLPPTKGLPTDVSGCSVEDHTLFSFVNATMSYPINSTSLSTAIPPSAREPTALDPFYNLSYLWYTTFGMLVSIIISFVISFLTGPRKADDIDDRLMYPLFYNLCPFLPENVRKYLKFGVVYKNHEEHKDKRHEDKIENEPNLLASTDSKSNVEDKSRSNVIEML